MDSKPTSSADKPTGDAGGNARRRGGGRSGGHHRGGGRKRAPSDVDPSAAVTSSNIGESNTIQAQENPAQPRPSVPRNHYARSGKSAPRPPRVDGDRAPASPPEQQQRQQQQHDRSHSRRDKRPESSQPSQVPNSMEPPPASGAVVAAAPVTQAALFWGSRPSTLVASAPVFVPAGAVPTAAESFSPQLQVQQQPKPSGQPAFASGTAAGTLRALGSCMCHNGAPSTDRCSKCSFARLDVGLSPSSVISVDVSALRQELASMRCKSCSAASLEALSHVNFVIMEEIDANGRVGARRLLQKSSDSNETAWNFRLGQDSGEPLPAYPAAYEGLGSLKDYFKPPVEKNRAARYSASQTLLHSFQLDGPDVGATWLLSATAAPPSEIDLRQALMLMLSERELDTFWNESLSMAEDLDARGPVPSFEAASELIRRLTLLMQELQKACGSSTAARRVPGAAREAGIYHVIPMLKRALRAASLSPGEALDPSLIFTPMDDQAQDLACMRVVMGLLAVRLTLDVHATLVTKRNDPSKPGLVWNVRSADSVLRVDGNSLARSASDAFKTPPRLVASLVGLLNQISNKLLFEVSIFRAFELHEGGSAVDFAALPSPLVLRSASEGEEASMESFVDSSELLKGVVSEAFAPIVETGRTAFIESIVDAVEQCAAVTRLEGVSAFTEWPPRWVSLFWAEEMDEVLPFVARPAKTKPCKPKPGTADLQELAGLNSDVLNCLSNLVPVESMALDQDALLKAVSDLKQSEGVRFWQLAGALLRTYRESSTHAFVEAVSSCAAKLRTARAKGAFGCGGAKFAFIRATAAISHALANGTPQQTAPADALAVASSAAPPSETARESPKPTWGAPPKAEAIGWACQTCTLHNEATAAECVACEAKPPPAPLRAASPPTNQVARPPTLHFNRDASAPVRAASPPTNQVARPPTLRFNRDEWFKEMNESNPLHRTVRMRIEVKEYIHGTLKGEMELTALWKKYHVSSWRNSIASNDAYFLWHLEFYENATSKDIAGILKVFRERAEEIGKYEFELRQKSTFASHWTTTTFNGLFRKGIKPEFREMSTELYEKSVGQQAFVVEEPTSAFPNNLRMYWIHSLFAHIACDSNEKLLQWQKKYYVKILISRRDSDAYRQCFVGFAFENNAEKDGLRPEHGEACLNDFLRNLKNEARAQRGLSPMAFREFQQNLEKSKPAREQRRIDTILNTPKIFGWGNPEKVAHEKTTAPAATEQPSPPMPQHSKPLAMMPNAATPLPASASKPLYPPGLIQNAADAYAARKASQQTPDQTMAVLQSLSLGASTTGAAGLTNRRGQNNCFLNVVAQALFQLDSFPRILNIDSTAQEDHRCGRSNGDSDTCMVCALRSTFRSLSESNVSLVSSEDMRDALALAFEHQNFAMNTMNDAAEAFEAVLALIHASNLRHGDDDVSSALTCDCVVHECFGIRLMEAAKCPSCLGQVDNGTVSLPDNLSPERFLDLVETAKSERLMVFHRYSTQIRYVISDSIVGAGTSPDTRFDARLLATTENEQPRSCPLCDGPDRKTLTVVLKLPKVYTIGLIWSTESESKENIHQVLQCISMRVNVRRMEKCHLNPNDPHAHSQSVIAELRGMICFYGAHYVTYLRLKGDANKWYCMNDSSVKFVGHTWKEAAEHCLNARFQPVSLFYEVLSPLDSLQAAQDSEAENLFYGTELLLSDP